MKIRTQIDPATGALRVMRGEAAKGRDQPRVRVLGGGGYAGAQAGRLYSDWQTSNRKADAELYMDGRILRSRARDLERNNPYFENYLAQAEANVLGDVGIMTTPLPRMKSGKPDRKAAALISEEWARFGERDNFTASRLQTRAAWGRMLLRSVIRDGDALVEIVRGIRNRDNFAVMAWEADYLNFNDNDAAQRVRMGVRKNAWGGHQSYRVHQEIPRQDDLWGLYGDDTPGRFREVRAEALGDMMAGSSGILAAVYHRFSQTRGQPWAACVMHLLHMLGMYEEAALVSARVGASKMGFLIDGTADDADGEEDWMGNPTLDAEPGTINRIIAQPGEVDFKSWDPNDPNGDYPAFRKGMLQGIAAGLKISYNVLGSDLEGVSFSSIRQGTLTEREIWKVVQRWYIETVELPIYRGWLEWKLANGQFPGLSWLDFDRLAHVEMSGRRWDYVNPKQDVEADVIAINNGLESRQGANRDRGRTFERIAREQEEDNEVSDAAGLAFPLDMPAAPVASDDTTDEG